MTKCHRNIYIVLCLFLLLVPPIHAYTSNNSNYKVELAFVNGFTKVSNNSNYKVQTLDNPDTLNSSKIFYITIIPGEGDTCVYTGSGNYIIDCSENCSIDFDYDILGNMTLEGEGIITLDHNITFISNNQYINIGKGCELAISKNNGIG